MVGTQTSLQEKPASITQRVTLYGISWQTYTRILTELGDQRASRLAYAPGVLEITMPSDRHETYKKLLERMIETLTEELNLPAKSFGATTLNRADLEHGAEPDPCYYIQHVHQIEGRQVDFATDPPPDLILGIDIAGLDHGVGHLISMTTEKRMTRYRDGLKPGSYLAILRPSTSHMVGALVGEVVVLHR